MPYSGYTLEGDSLLEMMSPPLRSVEYNFGDNDQDAAMMTVTHYMRCLWPLLPHTSSGPEAKDIMLAGPSTNEEASELAHRFMGPFSHLTEEQRKLLPADPDLTTLHTPWRDGVYKTLCHVFVDCYPILGESGGYERYGHYHHPDMEVFALDDGPSEVKTWDHNVMLLPAYLAPGVTVKLFMVQEDGTNVEKGDFDHEQPYKTWWMRAGVKLRLAFERVGKEGALSGHAAVILVGPACNRHAPETSEDGGAEQNDQMSGDLDALQET